MGISTGSLKNIFRNRFRNVLDIYIRSAPTPKNAINIFDKEWISRFPAPYTELTPGTSPLFDDDRLTWALKELGGVKDQTILELGPLEGGHTYMLDKAGAKSILAIEANTRAYLRCLVAREIVGTRNATFQLGDFTEYLETNPNQFDFIQASGVLYHMRDPIRLIKLISDHTRRVYIWTHYYEESVIRTKRGLSGNISDHIPTEIDGLKVVYHHHNYRRNLKRLTFLGGPASYSNWLSRDDILAALKHYGFNKITIGRDEPLHRNGPSFELVAVKT